MTNSYQKAAFRRKLIYFGLAVTLFVTSICVRGLVAMPTPQLEQSVGKWTIQEQSNRLDLSELNQGDVELSGSAIRLLLTGSRGFAVCALWISAQEIQMRQEWNKLELTVNSVTKLQPHFVTPWLFQSWNLAYNVSVEMDRLNDMYFYIAEGIKLLAKGEKINKNNPDIRYSIAFYYQNKFTVSDKVTTLRSLFELSCMPKSERDYTKLVKGGQVDPVAFKAFCENHPQLVRRLRETAIPMGKGADGKEKPPQFLVEKAIEVVSFLKDNESLPNRFQDQDPEKLEEDNLKQFPVLPKPFYRSDTEELNPDRAILPGQASAVRAARVWYRYANEVIPPANPVPGPVQNYRDPERKRRMPKQPAEKIFRQGPPRAQSYIAEQTEKEGWFESNNDDWIVDANRDAIGRWFKEDVVIKPQTNAQNEWIIAHGLWDQHGRANGMNLAPNELEGYRNRARLYAEKNGISLDGSIPPVRPRADDLADPALADSIKALDSLRYYELNRQQTNFAFFLYQSEMEKEDTTVKARKLFFQADKARRRADWTKAISLYEQAFGSAEKPGMWRNLFLQKKRQGTSNERLVERMAEETYEQQIHYTRCLLTTDRKRFQRATLALFDLMRPAVQASPLSIGLGDMFMQERRHNLTLAQKTTLALFDLMSPAGHESPLCVVLGNTMMQARGVDVLGQAKGVEALTTVEPIWPPGPFDGNDPDGNPWIPAHVKDRVRMNMNLTKQTSPPPAPKNDPSATEPLKQ